MAELTKKRFDSVYPSKQQFVPVDFDTGYFDLIGVAEGSQENHSFMDSVSTDDAMSPNDGETIGGESSSEDEFGGPVFVIMDRDLVIGQHHDLYATGFLRHNLTDEDPSMKVFDDPDLQCQAIAKMTSIGLKTGLLTIKSDKGESYRVSGFWLQPNKFITCAYFSNVFESGPERKAGIKKLLEVQESHQPLVTVCSHFSHCRRAGTEHEDIRVKLVKIHTDYDIAVFQAFDDQKMKLIALNEGREGAAVPLDFKDISTCDTANSISSSTIHLFTCGYAGSNKPSKHNESVMAYDRLLQRMGNDLKGEEKTEWTQDIKPNMPPFDAVFRPGNRAGSCGLLHPPASNDSTVSQIDGALTVTRNHGISTFYGNSGGMVARFGVDKDGKVKLEIIGMIRGRGFGNSNTFSAFTKNGLRYIKEDLFMSESYY